jgi:hypothetical protein
MNWVPAVGLAAAVGLTSIAGPAFAQDRHDEERSTRQQDKGRMGRDESRQSSELTRREAMAAFAQAKRECARERRDGRTECLRQARQDYNQQMSDGRRR